MIIQKVAKVRTSDPAHYAWTKLRKFQNIEAVTDTIVGVHDVPFEHRDNARKQARQLRYCMIQAREYFEAAKAVTIATKPNLLYYGTMSLALAEILMKQSGLSSLDKAREEHRHHGLTMSAGAIPNGANLGVASKEIRALPLEVSGRRRGTFEMWHRSSREHPLAGEQTVIHPTGRTTTAFSGLFGAFDVPYPPIPKAGLSLNDCLSGLPLMWDTGSAVYLPSRFIRGRCDSRLMRGIEWSQNIRLMFHPSPLVQGLIEQTEIKPDMVDYIDVAEVGGGLQIDLRSGFVQGHIGFRLPPAATIDTLEWRMWANNPPLNEFGYFYVALFLAGNYARYYPDRWLVDVEQSTPLGLAIEELCNIAEWRVPWLSLCELDFNLYVNEA